MLGWQIFVTGIDTEGNKKTIASWESGVNGCDWIEDLVQQKLAAYLGGNGYPNRYSMSFGLLLDKIIPSPPGILQPTTVVDDSEEKTTFKFKLHDDVILDIDSNTKVEIEAWDLS